MVVWRAMLALSGNATGFRPTGVVWLKSFQRDNHKFLLPPGPTTERPIYVAQVREISPLIMNPNDRDVRSDIYRSIGHLSRSRKTGMVVSHASISLPPAPAASHFSEFINQFSLGTAMLNEFPLRPAVYVCRLGCHGNGLTACPYV